MRHRIRRVLSVVISVAVTLSFFQGASFVFANEANDHATNDECTRVCELSEFRESNSETYLLDDGTYECVVYSDDKYYKDEDGTYKTIDNSLISIKKEVLGIEYDYVNNANDMKSYFDGESPSVRIEYRNHNLSFSLLGSKNVTGKTNLKEGDYSVSGYTIEGNSCIAYPNTMEGVDVVYSIGNKNVKEYIILNNSRISEFSFVFNTDGLEIKEGKKGEPVVCDSFGSPVFELGALFAIDSDGAYTDDLQYSLFIRNEQETIVKISIAQSYLNSPDRVFPVLIDPAIEISGSSNIYDSFVSSRYPNSNYVNNAYVRTGKDTDYYVRRTYMRFVIPSIVYQGGIISSYINIRKYSGVTPSVTVNRVTGSWSSSTINWNNKPGYTTDYNSSLYNYSGTWYRAYVTAIVQGWIYGANDNNGFVLVDSVENNTSHWTTFYSSDAPSPNKPELHIVYTLDKDAQLFGVTTSGHDHSSCLYTAKTHLEYCNLNNINVHVGTFTTDGIRDYMDDDDNAVYISRSLGAAMLDNNNVLVLTEILLNESGTPTWFNSYTSMNMLDLSNIQLAMFIAHETGKGGAGAANLPTGAVNRGALTAVGFLDEINCTKANSWIIDFCELMRNGYTVYGACSALAARSDYSNTSWGLTKYVICGNRYVTLADL